MGDIAFFIDNLPIRINFIVVMTRRTGLAPCEFEFPFPGILTSTVLQVGDDSLGFHMLSGLVTVLVQSRLIQST